MGRIKFLIEKDVDGGYNARAIGESIFTEADTIDQLKLNIAAAIECHFDNEPFPEFIIEFV